MQFNAVTEPIYRLWHVLGVHTLVGKVDAVHVGPYVISIQDSDSFNDFSRFLASRPKSTARAIVGL